MTSLRSFQNEIEDIHQRELAKQRGQPSMPIDKEKENKNPVDKGKAITKEKDDDHLKASVLERTEMLEVEEKVMVRRCIGRWARLISQKMLLSAPDHDAARDIIASLITQNHGEYVFRIGAQPPHNLLFSGELTDDAAGWIGIERSVGDVDLLRKEIIKAVEEIGGKVL